MVRTSGRSTAVRGARGTPAAAPLLSLFAIMACAFFLAACGQPRVYVQFHTQDPVIQAAVKNAVAAWHDASPGTAPVEMWPTGRGAPGQRAQVIHVGFRALAPSVATSAALEGLGADFGERSGLATGLAIERWARAADGTWTCAPILWDVWGISYQDGGVSVASGGLEWSALGSVRGMTGALVVAGASPAGRQALLAYVAAQNGLTGELESLYAAKAGSRTAGTDSLFSAWVTADRATLFYPDTLRFAEADVDNLAGGPGGGGLVILTSYRKAFLPGGSAQRAFIAVPAALGSGKYALVGTILAAWVTGPKGASASAESFLAYLLSPGAQRALSIGTGFMPANFTAPVLEGTNAAILALALRAEAVLGVNPEPADEPAVKALDDALAAIRADPANWASHIPGQ
jgi:hypothetical protein